MGWHHLPGAQCGPLVMWSAGPPADKSSESASLACQPRSQLTSDRGRSDHILVRLPIWPRCQRYPPG